MARRPRDQSPARGDPESTAPTEQPPGSGDGEEPPPPLDDLAAVLRAVVLVGIDHATLTALSGLMGLRCARDRVSEDSDDGRAAAGREVIRAALDALGDGNFGRAARALFGATADTRGQPARDRRRLAADQIDVMPDWFRRRYEPQIVRDVAAEIQNLERAATAADNGQDDDDGTGSGLVVISDDEPSTDLAPVAEDYRRRPVGRVHRVLTRVRHPLTADLTEQGGPVVLASTPRPVAAVQSRELSTVLRGLRDQQARRSWHLVWIAGGVVVGARYGREALPRYVLALALVGLLWTVAQMVRQWRATRSLALGESWPRLILFGGAAVFAAGFNVGMDDNTRDSTRTDGCELFEQPCNDNTPDPTTDPHPSPNYVPPTYADVPTEAADPVCPPTAGATDRTLSFTGVPPMCINPERRYVATIHTNYGNLTVTLNTGEAPWTVNNFVFLARWGFYDGVQLIPGPTPDEPTVIPTDVWSHLYSGSPTNPSDPTTRATTTVPYGSTPDVPGYRMAFEAHQGDYPDDDTLYLAMTNPNQPDQFAIVITPEGHNRAELGAAAALLGVVEPDCHEVIAQRDDTGAWDVSPRSEAIVIDAITITEEPANTPTTTRADPCGRLAAADEE